MHGWYVLDILTPRTPTHLDHTMIDTKSLTNAGFKGDVILPGDSEYEEANKRWSRFIERQAGVVVRPRSTEDVALAVKFAVQGGYPVVVKGQSPSPCPATT